MKKLSYIRNKTPEKIHICTLKSAHAAKFRYSYEVFQGMTELQTQLGYHFLKGAVFLYGSGKSGFYISEVAR